MTKTVSVAQLGHGGASRAVRDAQDAPVLVSKENKPAAWLVSAAQMAGTAAAIGAEREYQQLLAGMAARAYEDGALTLGQGAKLAGMPLGDFIDFCSLMGIPVLWDSENLDEEVDALEALVRPAPPDR